METKLEKEVRFLKIYAAMATLFCAAFFLSAFAVHGKKPKFEEADVVEAKGEAVRKIPDEAARKAAVQALIDNNESTQQRLFLGKKRDNAAMLLMSGVKGRPRIRMQVAPDGTPKLEFLDEAGKVTYSLPNSSSAPKP